jgi:hypothetical protein
MKRPETMKRTLLVLGLCALPLMASAALAALPSSGAAPVSEEFHYRWSLGNFLGTIASLFLPHQGVGELTFKPQKNGRLRAELVITSPSSRAGEYWRYGAEVDPKTQQTVRAWSSYLWRGEQKSKSEEIADNGVLDVVSGIYAIRRDPPDKPRRMDIWSDGKIYQVIVLPLGVDKKRVGPRTVDARHYSIRGIDAPSDRSRKWKGRLELWLATDESATPVEILISRNLADVRLVMTSSTQGTPEAADKPAR